MNALNRLMIFLLLLVLLGVGIRLMYFGLQSLVGYSSSYSPQDLLWMLLGIVLFVGGIIIGVRFLPSESYR